MKKDGDFIISAKLTAKNQITIPKAVREKLSVSNGDSLVFYLGDNSEIKISNRKNCKVEIELEDKEKQIAIMKGDNNE